MIIMNPNDICGPQNVLESIAKYLVDLLVLLPKRLLINGKSWKVMEQRPDRGVAKTEIELFHLIFGKKHRIRAKGSERLTYQLSSQRHLDTTARPADPKMIAAQGWRALTRLHERRQSGNQATSAFMK